jgi:hypothetical protein
MGAAKLRNILGIINGIRNQAARTRFYQQSDMVIKIERTGLK